MNIIKLYCLINFDFFRFEPNFQLNEEVLNKQISISLIDDEKYWVPKKKPKKM